VEESWALSDRITQVPGKMGGKACIRGMLVTVSMIVRQISTGRTIDEILGDYPYLEREDVIAALDYAPHIRCRVSPVDVVAGNSQSPPSLHFIA